MGASYSAGVFFGAFVSKSSQLGMELHKYIDDAGGTPAETEIPGVVITFTGSMWSGDIWIVVMVKESGRVFRMRESDPKPPDMLTARPDWEPKIAAFFRRFEMLQKAPPIGWHFAGTVT